MRLLRMIQLYLATEGISQNDLCRELGIDKTTLSRFLNGKQVHASTFAKLLTWALEPKT